MNSWPRALTLSLYVALVPVVVVLTVAAAIAGHVLWSGHADAVGAMRATVSQLGLDRIALTPSGRPPRQGPSPHPAVDGRQVAGEIAIGPGAERLP